MKFYLAARYSRRDEMREVARRLRGLGHEVTSRWIDTAWEMTEEKRSSAAPPEQRTQFALWDFEDLRAADCVVNFTEEPKSKNAGGRGGRHVEFGAALILGKRLVVVGWQENIFHHLPQVEFYSALGFFFDALAEAKK